LVAQRFIGHVGHSRGHRCQQKIEVEHYVRATDSADAVLGAWIHSAGIFAGEQG
jgi:hypothetical protein